MVDNTVDTILWVASICGGLWTIFSFSRNVMSPFRETMKSVQEAISNLQKTIDKINYDMDFSKADRVSIHTKLDEHEDDIQELNMSVARNTEQITNIYHRLKEKQ